jgi:hypothetical protein
VHRYGSDINTAEDPLGSSSSTLDYREGKDTRSFLEYLITFVAFMDRYLRSF